MGNQRTVKRGSEEHELIDERLAYKPFVNLFNDPFGNINLVKDESMFIVVAIVKPFTKSFILIDEVEDVNEVINGLLGSIEMPSETLNAAVAYLTVAIERDVPKAKIYSDNIEDDDED